MKMIDCIVLLSLALNAIFLTSSVKTLCLSLLNLRFDFIVSLLFPMNSIWFPLVSNNDI